MSWHLQTSKKKLTVVVEFRGEVANILHEEEAKRRKEEEDNERLLREFLAAEEKARLAEAEMAAAQVSYVTVAVLRSCNIPFGSRREI